MRWFRRFAEREQSRPLYWWQPPVGHPFGITQNFGDALNPWLYEQLTGKVPRHAEAHRRRKILAIGSVLVNVRPGDVVWGSGLNGKVKDGHGKMLVPKKLERVTFKAVRGPLTREALVAVGGDVPEVYGDPALLVGQWLTPPAQASGTVVLPHFSDFVQAKNLAPSGTCVLPSAGTGKSWPESNQA